MKCASAAGGRYETAPAWKSSRLWTLSAAIRPAASVPGPLPRRRRLAMLPPGWREEAAPMPGVPDVSPQDTWDALCRDPEAALVDVRTDAEWNFVGLPDLSEAAKQPLLIPWQLYPSMQVN